MNLEARKHRAWNGHCAMSANEGTTCDHGHVPVWQDDRLVVIVHGSLGDDSHIHLYDRVAYDAVPGGKGGRGIEHLAKLPIMHAPPREVVQEVVDGWRLMQGMRT